MSIRKADTHVSESSTVETKNVANTNSDSIVLKLKNLALDLIVKKIDLEQDETFFQLFKGTDVVHEFESKNNLIHYAAFYNLEPLLKLIIKHYPEALKTKNMFGDLAIHCTRDCNSTKILVEAGSPIDERDSEGLTPLMNAVLCKSEDTILYLLENGADPTLPILDLNKPIKFLTDDKFIIECIEEYESKWIIKDDKKV